MGGSAIGRGGSACRPIERHAQILDFGVVDDPTEPQIPILPEPIDLL